MKFKEGDYILINPNVEMEWGTKVENWGGQIMQEGDVGHYVIQLDAPSIESFDEQFLFYSYFQYPSPELLILHESELLPGKKRSTEEEEGEAFESVGELIEKVFIMGRGVFEKQRVDWMKGFVESDFYKKQTNVQKENSEKIINNFIEWGLEYFDVDAYHWNDDIVQEISLTVLPESGIKDKDFVTSFAPVMINYFSFLGSIEALPETEDLVEVMEDIQEIIPSAVENPERMDITRQLVELVIESGVDPTDESAVQEFMTDMLKEDGMENLAIPPDRNAPRPARVDPFRHIGRNDKITVKYEDGKLVSDIKFKKVEADLRSGKCELIED